MRATKLTALLLGSAALAFSQGAAPLAITSLTPDTYTMGHDVNVTILGTGLTSTIQVSFYYTLPVATSPVQLTGCGLGDVGFMCPIPAAMLATAGTAWIEVSNGSQTDRKAFMVTPHLAVSNSSLMNGRESYAYGQYIDTTGTGTGTRMFLWNETGQLPPGLSLGSDGLVSGTPTTAGTYIFGVMIQDQLETIDQNITITIDHKATITTTTLPDGVAGTPYSQQLTQSWGIQPCTWSALQTLPAWLTLSSSGLLSGTPPLPAYVSVYVQLTCRTASPSAGPPETATASFGFYVATAPLVILTTSPLPSGKVSTPYNLQFQASGGQPPYIWAASGTLPPGLTLSSSGLLTGTPTASGSYTFSVQLADSPPLAYAAAERRPAGRVQASARGGRLASTGTSFTIQIDPLISPLTLAAPSVLASGTVGTPYSYWFQALGGQQPYSWSSKGTLPPGLSLDPRLGKLSGTPTTAGTYSFQVSLRDDASGAVDSDFSITIAALPLAVATSSLPTATAGAAYSQALAATGGLQPYSWAVASGALPAGLALNASTGVIAGTPSAPGPSAFTVRVTDKLNGSATADLSISVQAAQLALAPATPPQGVVGTPYSLGLSATGDLTPYTWSVTAGSLPPGLALDSTTGAVSGTPTTRGSYDFTVQVKGSAGQTATAALRITIAPPPLAITSSATLASGTVRQSYSAALSATGGVPDYTWSVSTGSLPAGLSLSASGAIAGTPTASGTSTFTIQVRDSAQTVATLAATLVINPPPLAFATEALPDGTFGVAYSQTISATGGNTPYTFSIASGTLPGGLSLDAHTGALSGTPSAAGTFTFNVAVADSTSGSPASSSRAFTLTVKLPAAANPGFTGLSDTMNAAQQASFGVALTSGYPLPLDGALTLSFAPETGLPDDPAIAFLSGGRTLGFTVAAGQTQSQFSVSNVGLQTGTVAGVITISARFQQGGTDVTPSPAPSRTIRIPRVAPGISSVRATRIAGGLQIEVFGYSTPRDITQARFRFTAATGSALQGADFTVQLGPVFAAWYRDAASNQFGSAFRYVQPFTVQGDTGAVASVEVTLTNSTGDSQPVTANFQ